MKKIIPLVFLAALFISCGVSKEMARVKVAGDLSNYTHAYIMPTGSASTATTGVAVGMVYTGTTAASNPSDIICGYLMKKGYTIVPQIKPEQAKNTMIVTYGQVSSSMDWSAEHTCMIQLLDAESQELIAYCEANGTSAKSMKDALQRAIYNALNSIFKVAHL